MDKRASNYKATTRLAANTPTSGKAPSVTQRVSCSLVSAPGPESLSFAGLSKHVEAPPEQPKHLDQPGHDDALQPAPSPGGRHAAFSPSGPRLVSCHYLALLPLAWPFAAGPPA
ncbi:hypothetical protein CDD81_7060 [Ophiocordyceps australis]|uniref:Uncharacterized protein n=1 Tax=Ophiocordyceps australis TaxID=1399860 RepID=A0A2C5YAQ4_9HYPO|nr:hypothetical protein CDD81_7060 [Ophiocordyceps australis]